MSEYYPDSHQDTMRDKVEVIIRALDGNAATWTALRHPILLPDTHGCDFTGKKYWRVWRQGWDSTHGTPVPHQRAVEFFVEIATGNVLKGSWTAPESKDARFNIDTPEGRARLMAHKQASHFGYLYKDRIAAFEKGQ